VVQQAVDGGAGEQLVLEERAPLVDRPIRSDDQGAALIPLADHFVEVERFVVDQGAQPEVVDDQQIGGGEAQQLAVVGLIGAGHAELGEHIVGGDVEDLVAHAAGAVTERLADMRLADAGRADQQDVLVALDEVAGREVDDLRARDLRVEGEVEGLKGPLVFEVGAAESQRELLVSRRSVSSWRIRNRNSA